MLCLLGDKDHAKVYEAVAKVAKVVGRGAPWSGSFHRGRGDGLCRGRGMRNSASIQCHYCGKFGHIMAKCYARRDAQQGPLAARGHAKDNK